MLPTLEKIVKRIGLAIGVVFGFLALLAFTTIWEPRSAVVKAHKFAIGTLVLCFFSGSRIVCISPQNEGPAYRKLEI